MENGLFWFQVVLIFLSAGQVKLTKTFQNRVYCCCPMYINVRPGILVSHGAMYFVSFHMHEVSFSPYTGNFLGIRSMFSLGPLNGISLLLGCFENEYE